jgi:hypothetical protein
MLSRYYSHLSHLDGISFDQIPKRKFIHGTQILPMLLLFDVGNCLVNVMEHLLFENKIASEAFTGGRTGHEFKAAEYVRASTYVMCEKHSRKKPVPLSLLLKNIAGINGDIGLTGIYRGGMEIFRYGDAASRPELEKIKECAIFAIGNADSKRIVVDLKDIKPKGERYELRWPKDWEVTYSAIAMVSRHATEQFELFDYITDFVSLIQQCRRAETPEESVHCTRPS